MSPNFDKILNSTKYEGNRISLQTETCNVFGIKYKIKTKDYSTSLHDRQI